VVDPLTGRLVVSNAGSCSVTIIEDRLTGPFALSPVAEHPLVGRRLPPFALPGLAPGVTFDSRQWAERLYILNFFASW
jgi:hypothetical protein